MTARAWVVLASVLAGSFAGCARAPRPDELSVIVVTLDTTRADRIGAFGGPDGLSPHIDRLAREGVVAAEAVTQVPLTLPAHASLFTGRYPASHGVRHNGIFRLRDEEETLAEHLKGAGLETAGFVAAFVLNRGFGVEQGFGTFDDVPIDRFAGGRDQIFEAERTGDEVNAAVFKWLAGRRGGRFFLWVHYYDPHEPYAPPERPGRTLAGTGYDREISYMDACLGDLVARLRADKILDRALLVVVGDHGESLGEHGEKTHGIFLYEPAVHVPLLLRAPGLFPSGASLRGPVELVDVAPTVLDYLGLPPLSRAQGKSLRPRIDGTDDGKAAVAHAETLMPRLEFGWAELRMVRDGRFKFLAAPRPELYDLRGDPKEERNLAGTQDDRAGEMASTLDAWVAATTDAAADASAQRTLDPDEEARLRSLGYLGGDAFKSPGARVDLVDPKDGIQEMKELDLARERLAAGDAAGAVARVTPILVAHPHNHQARATKIRALIALSQLAAAEDEALQALAASQTGDAASPALANKSRGLLASVLRLQGRDREAEAQYRKILAADPGNESIALDLARLLVDTQRPDEAARLIEGVLARDPRNGMALAARFRLETAQGAQGARLSTARAMADARAGDPQTLGEAARLLESAGDPARAAICYELLVAQTPQPGAELLGTLGVTRLKAGDVDGAQEALAAAAAQAPSDPRPVYLLGRVALRRGDAAGARARFQEALRLDPGFVQAANALGDLDRPRP